jgi:hypothetical protein
MPNKIELDIDKVIQLYNEYRSLKKVSKLLGVSISPVKRILYSNNIILNSAKKYEVDEDYFINIDTEDKAYWLGFLYADGYVRIRKTGNSLEFKQHKRDMDIFEKFKECIKSTHPVNPVKGGNTYVISITNNKIVNNIVGKGCLPRKSHILKFPDGNILPSYLHSHFIRGVFDGDGSISLLAKKQPAVNIAGTKDMVESIKKILGLDRSCISKVHNKSGTYTWYITIQNKLDVMCFYKYIYTNANTFMDRKLNKFKELINGGYMNYNYNIANRNRDSLGRFI